MAVCRLSRSTSLDCKNPKNLSVPGLFIFTGTKVDKKETVLSILIRFKVFKVLYTMVLLSTCHFDFSLSPEPARLLSPLHHQHPRRGRRTFWTLSESSLELGSPHRLHQGKLSSRGIFSWESRWCERWLHRGATA